MKRKSHTVRQNPKATYIVIRNTVYVNNFSGSVVFNSHDFEIKSA